MADEFREMKDEMKADLREMADDFGRMRNEIARETAAMKHELAADRAQRNADRGRTDGEYFVAQIASSADIRPVIGVAVVEATNRASATVEAEHLLLALLFARTSTGAKLLAEHGLTYEAFDAALREERVQTLARIGVTIPEPDRLQAAPRVRMHRGRFSASAKEAFERASKAVKAKRGRAQRFTDIDFLVGVMSAELGTVPRALVRGGFDRRQILEALLAAQAGR